MKITIHKGKCIHINKQKKKHILNALNNNDVRIFCAKDIKLHHQIFLKECRILPIIQNEDTTRSF